MENFDKKFLQFFLENIENKDGKVILSQEVVDKTLDLLNEKVSSVALSTISQDFYQELILEEDIEKEVENEEFNIYSYVIMKAITYFLINRNEDGYVYINYILRSEFFDIVDELIAGEKISNFIIKNYMRYLIAKAYGTITDEDCEKVFDKYPWLDDLSYNRGFKSLNDKARVILLHMVDALEEIDTAPDKIYEELDNYFSDGKSNYFMKVEFPDLSNERDIINFKRYQFKLILADSYLSLKGWDLQANDGDAESTIPLNEEEAHILTLLEDAILNDDYSRIKNLEIIHSLYNYFLIYNVDNIVRQTHTELLDAHDSIHILKMVNPIYFMD